MAVSDLWWIFPLIMVILCVFMMSGRMRGMCGMGSHGDEGRHGDAPGSALDILRKRYASGEIDRAEYDEKKRDLSGTTDQ